MKQNYGTQQNKRPHNKEAYIQFLRGPMTDLVKRHSKTESETNKGIAVLEKACKVISEKGEC